MQSLSASMSSVVLFPEFTEFIWRCSCRQRRSCHWVSVLGGLVVLSAEMWQTTKGQCFQNFSMSLTKKKEEDLSYALGWGFPGVPPVQYGQDGYSDPSSVDTCQVGKDEIWLGQYGAIWATYVEYDSTSGECSWLNPFVLVWRSRGNCDRVQYFVIFESRRSWPKRKTLGTMDVTADYDLLARIENPADLL